MEQFKGMNQEERIADVLTPYHKEKALEYTPSRQEALKQHEIHISFLSRGCVINVGCKTIPFSSTEDAIIELQKYFDNPHETQLRWKTQLV